MKPVDVDRILRECAYLGGWTDDPELERLQTAILIEETFNLVLTDEQLSGDLLQNTSLLHELLAKTSTST